MGDRAKREYVRKCDKEFLDCISECAKNVIKGNVPLTHVVRSDDRTTSKATRPQSTVREEDVAANETQDSTERRISYRTTATDSVRTG